LNYSTIKKTKKGFNIMKTLTTILTMLALTFSLLAQSDWVNVNNSGGMNPDNSFHHAVDNAGNTYVTGYGAPGGYPNGHLIKISPTGTLLWTKTFYGYNGGNAIGRKILIDQSSNIYVISEGKSFGNSWDLWLHKFDPNGNNVFSMRYGEPAYNESIGDAIFDNSGNIVVAVSGRTASDSLENINLIKYNSSGIPVLFKTYDIPGGNAAGGKLLMDNSGNIFVAGSISYPSTSNTTIVMVLKYDSQLQHIYSNFIVGGTGTNTYFGDAELMLGSDVVVCVSYLQNSWSERNLRVVKFNNLLSTVWSKDYNIAAGLNEDPSDMVFDRYNNIFIGGRTSGYSSSANAMTIMLDIDGNLLWNRSYDRNGNHDEVNKIGVDNFGNVYSCGISSVSQNMDAMIIKYDPSGTQQFVYNYNGLGFGTDVFNYMTVSPGGTITANGITTGSSTGTDFLTVKLTGHLLTGISGNSGETPESYSLSQNYPNPFNPATKISFSLPNASHVRMVVFDVTGKVVETIVDENLSPGSFEVDFDAGKLTSGVYFYRITTEGFTDTKKMILVK